MTEPNEFTFDRMNYLAFLSGDDRETPLKTAKEIMSIMKREGLTYREAKEILHACEAGLEDTCSIK